MRWGWVLVAILMVLGSAGAFWCGAFESSPREALPPVETSSRAGSNAVSITIASVTRRTVQRTVEVVGTLHGFEEVALSAKTEGRVRKVLHDVADRVRPEEPLLEIDPTDYELSVRQADKGLRVELAKLGLDEPPSKDFDVTKVPIVQQAAVKLEQMKSRFERARTLAANKTSTAEELAERTAEFRIAEAEYENQLLVAKGARATIQMKQEALAIAQQQLLDTVIRAPTPTRTVPGTDGDMTYAISRRDVSEGSSVRAGTEVLRLVIDQTLKLRVAVPERHSGEIEAGQLVEVFTAGFAKPFAGKVARINPAIEPETRTFEVEVRVPNPNGQLKPGGFAKATILTHEDHEATTVPLEALVTFAGVTKLFVVEQDHSREVLVTVGLQSREWVEITEPKLARDAIVVTSGQTALSDGAAVRVRE